MIYISLLSSSIPDISPQIAATQQYEIPSTAHNQLAIISINPQLVSIKPKTYRTSTITFLASPQEDLKSSKHRAYNIRRELSVPISASFKMESQKPMIRRPTFYYRRLYHTTSCMMIYNMANDPFYFDYEQQSFIYHAYVHLGFAAEDAAKAFTDKYQRYFGLKQQIIQAIVEYIDVYAITTSLNSVQEKHAPLWKPYQVPHWMNVRQPNFEMKNLVNEFRNPNQTSRDPGEYYNRPIPWSTQETT